MLSKPNLVSNRTLKRIDKLFDNNIIEKPTWNFSMIKLYKDYIRPNLFAIIVFVLLTIFLSMKYYLKQERLRKHKEKKRKSKHKKYKQNNYKVKYEEPEIKTDAITDVIAKPKYYTADELRSIYTDEEPLIDSATDEYSIYDLEKEYKNLKQNNNGYYSNEMIDDMMKNTSSKYMFNELAKMISGNN